MAVCELPFRHFKGECRLLLRGNLLWFEGFSDRRKQKQQQQQQQMGRDRVDTVESVGPRGHHSTDTDSNDVGEALDCVSISHTTLVRSISDTSLEIVSSYLAAAATKEVKGAAGGVSAVREKPVRIAFLTAHAKQRMVKDLAAVAECTRSGMSGPPAHDMYVFMLACPVWMCCMHVRTFVRAYSTIGGWSVGRSVGRVWCSTH